MCAKSRKASSAAEDQELQRHRRRRPTGVLRDQGNRRDAVRRRLQGRTPRFSRRGLSFRGQRFLITMRQKRSSQPRLQGRRPDPARSDGADRARAEGPAVGMVTIQAVEVTPDYAHAKIFFTLLVGDVARMRRALNQAAGFLRNGLFKRCNPHRADAALPVRPHDRACGRHECADREGRRFPCQRRLR